MTETIRILGVSESIRMRLLKANVQEALQRMGLSMPIEEISEIDQLMEYGILGIPALIVGRRILFQQEVPEVEYIMVALAEQLRPSGKPMNSMSTRGHQSNDRNNFE